MFTKYLHILCKYLPILYRGRYLPMLKGNKNITHMPRCHASIVIKSRTVALFWGKIAVHFALFSDKLPDWQEFYTTTGRAKYQLWSV